MDFRFTPEQEQLRTHVRSFVEQHPPAGHADGSPDRSSWAEIARLGWVGASIPEAQGGAGLGFLEEAVVLEELARALYAGPYFSTVVLALPALACAPELLARVASGGYTATLAWRERGRAGKDEAATEARRVDGRWLLRGAKRLVPDADRVDAFVVVAHMPEGVGLFLVERRGGRPGIDAPETVDATRRLGSVTLEDDEGRLLAGAPEAEQILARTRPRALAALALEAVGVGSTALALGVAHAKTRQQFGRPLGAYQAVSHKLADTYVEVELARSLAYWAAWCIAEDAPEASVAAVAAKAYAAEAAVAACERAIQVHGGMGFTWEHPLHRYYKRALWIESFDRPGAGHRAEIARAILDGKTGEMKGEVSTWTD